MVVQKYLRKYLAKKVYFKMLSDAIDQMKLRKINIIQKQARIFISRIREINKMRNAQAKMIQKFMKGKLAQRKMMACRDYVRKVTKIQLYYKQRYADKTQSTITVQKFLKGLKVFRKYRRLRSVSHATINILE